MLFNTVYVDGGVSMISFVSGLYDYDGIICTPYIISDDIESIDITNLEVI